ALDVAFEHRDHHVERVLVALVDVLLSGMADFEHCDHPQPRQRERSLRSQRSSCLTLKPRTSSNVLRTCCVIVMMVGNKNRSDLRAIYTSLRSTACDAVAGINDIVHPIDG